MFVSTFKGNRLLTFICITFLPCKLQRNRMFTLSLGFHLPLQSSCCGNEWFKCHEVLTFLKNTLWRLLSWRFASECLFVLWHHWLSTNCLGLIDEVKRNKNSGKCNLGLRKSFSNTLRARKCDQFSMYHQLTHVSEHLDETSTMIFCDC